MYHPPTSQFTNPPHKNTQTHRDSEESRRETRDQRDIKMTTIMTNSHVKQYWLCFAWIIILIATITMVAEGEDCQSDLLGLEIECLYYMHKGVPPLQDPNDRCCKVIQSANIPCVCTKLSQPITFPPGYTIEDMLDWDKVLHCLNFCGKPLPSGFKCGHFTVPPGPPPK